MMVALVVCIYVYVVFFSCIGSLSHSMDSHKVIDCNWLREACWFFIARDLGTRNLLGAFAVLLFLLFTYHFNIVASRKQILSSHMDLSHFSSRDRHPTA